MEENVFKPIEIVTENDMEFWDPVIEENMSISNIEEQEYKELIEDKLAPMKEQDIDYNSSIENFTIKNQSSNITEISSENLIHYIKSIEHESSLDLCIIKDIQNERFKNLDKLENYNFDSRYVCSPMGIVYRLKYEGNNKYTGIPMRPFITRDGYIEYVLTNKSGSKSHIQGQRIVAGLYLNKPIGKDYVDHINGNRADNRVENLEWVTASENQRRTWLDGRKRRLSKISIM